MTFNNLVKNICNTYENGKSQAYKEINTILLKTYWQIGKHIVEYEQKGEKRAKYGSKLIKRISKDLTKKYEKGFSIDSIERIRRFYLTYKNSATLLRNLNWTKYLELIKIYSKTERSFYEIKCLKENWSIRDLKRQIKSNLYYRIPNKSNNKLITTSQENIIKDPYILEFLKLNEKHSEKDLENSIIKNLEKFLFELGKEFSFIKRQYRINISKNNYYVDLVFFNNKLNCYFLIDLKIGKINSKDIGQMNLYINYFKENINSNKHTNPIGLILGKTKNNIEIKYAKGNLNNNLFTSKYLLHLPSKEDIKNYLGDRL